jgi:hypothetical protein
MYKPKVLSRFLSLLFGVPADPAYTDPPFSPAPDGMRWIHTADNAAEADMLRQMLQANGFHVEFVPSATAGVFGTTGSPHIYMPEDEADAASQFLAAYFASPPADSDE